MTYVEWLLEVIQRPFESGLAGFGLTLSTMAALGATYAFVARPLYDGLPPGHYPAVALILPFLVVGFAAFLALSPLFYWLDRATTPPPEPLPELDDAERTRRLRALLERLG